MFRRVLIIAAVAVSFFLFPVKAIANPGAYAAAELLSQYAAAAGLSEAQFVATVAGIASYGTGVNLANQAGISLAETVEHNLSALVDAADYKPWEELESGTQQIWGSKQNYESAKFNSLMTAFGYGEVTDEFISSGGGTFEPSEDLKRKLERIGAIGSRWMAGFGNTIGDIKSLITDNAAILDFPLQFLEGAIVDGSEVENWPNGVPKELVVSQGSEVIVQAIRSGVSWYSKWAIAPSSWIMAFRKNDYSYGVLVCSKESYVLKVASPGTDVNVQPSIGIRVNSVYGDESFYYSNSEVAFDSRSVINNANVGLNAINRSLSESEAAVIAKQILYGQVSGEGEYIEGYPDNPSDDDETYFPSEGVSDETSWPTIITRPSGPVVNPPSNPYNPTGEDGKPYTDTPAWRNEATQNTLPLLVLPFDKLFPFCLLYDVPLFLDKILMLYADGGGGIRTQAIHDYTRIEIHIPAMDGLGLPGYDFTIDLVWLEQLLEMVKPWLQGLLIIALLVQTIDFWQGILTG